MANTSQNGWGLEVVRGQESGRVYPLGPGRSVLGNGLNGESGVDLGAQEGPSPRRMAARQAEVECSAVGLGLRDLDSPGGTFVNRQRVLPGQTRRLQAGDVIQLGGVQLRVVERSARPAPPAAPPAPAAQSAPATPKLGPLPTPYTLATGLTSRSWDDFLTVSSQSWVGLRDELTSGRLGAFLRSIGRDDLQPMPAGAKSDDERLDAWLGRLPVTRALEPDLEVHPAVLRVRATAGGGVVRQKVVVTNTGYRLLRSSLRVEPPGTAWVRVAAPNGPGTFTTAESTEIPVEIEVPEAVTAPLRAEVVVESNGGTRRVDVRVEPAAKPELPIETGSAARAEVGRGLSDALAGVSPAARVAAGLAVGLLTRGLLALGDRVVPTAGAAAPGLRGAGLVMAVVGAVVAARLAARRGVGRDLAPAAFAGAFAGLLAAALAVAACRSVEPGAVAARPVVACGLWAAFGGIAALGSLKLVPHPTANEKGAV